MFLKKLTNSEKSRLGKNAGYREREALQKTYCVTRVPTSPGHDVIRLHYWKTENDGVRQRKVRSSADYDRRTGRWV